MQREKINTINLLAARLDLDSSRPLTSNSNVKKKINIFKTLITVFNTLPYFAMQNIVYRNVKKPIFVSKSEVMRAIFIKELNSFFSSLSGLIAAIVFLIINGLFMWVFPGELNVLDSGYSSLETLFILAPWVFLFLVPAVTMRSFSEEKRTGTIELLLTRPITDNHLVLGKFLASIVLILIILVPALIFFVSVYLLGNPVGNIDTGGTWGSFIGLFLLATGYASIGIFASSLTDNQIVSFIIAVVISFIMFLGIESIASVHALRKIQYFIVNLGINEHYRSLSRGVIDSRNIVYFVSLSAIFLFATRTVIQSRKW